MMNLQVFVLFLCLIIYIIKYYIINTDLSLSLPFLFIFFFGFYTYIVQQKCIDLKTAPYSFENNSRIRLSNEFSVEKNVRC